MQRNLEDGRHCISSSIWLIQTEDNHHEGNFAIYFLMVDLSHCLGAKNKMKYARNVFLPSRGLSAVQSNSKLHVCHPCVRLLTSQSPNGLYESCLYIHSQYHTDISAVNIGKYDVNPISAHYQR